MASSLTSRRSWIMDTVCSLQIHDGSGSMIQMIHDRIRESHSRLSRISVGLPFPSTCDSFPTTYNGECLYPISYGTNPRPSSLVPRPSSLVLPTFTTQYPINDNDDATILELQKKTNHVVGEDPNSTHPQPSMYDRSRSDIIRRLNVSMIPTP